MRPVQISNIEGRGDLTDGAPAATPTPSRPARSPDALQYVALFLLFVGGELAFKSPWTALGKDWCRRGDLNPHVVAHTRP